MRSILPLSTHGVANSEPVITLISQEVFVVTHITGCTTTERVITSAGPHVIS